MPDAQRAVTECRRRGGVARASELRASAVTKRDLAAAVAEGLLETPRRGLYTLPSLAPDVTDALRHRGAVACATAARGYGLWTLDDGEDEPTHIWIHPDRHKAEPDSECGARHHRDEPVDGARLWIVGLVHCLAQLAWCKGPDSFIAALESALRKGLVAASGLAALRAAVPKTMAWLVDYARSDADSGLESLVRYRLHLRGIQVATQVRIVGVGIVDFVIGDCLIIEADGATHEDENRHRDLVRDAVAMSLGFVTLRFDSAMILHDWDVVEAAIVAALDRRLHRSAAGLRAEHSTPVPENR